VTVLEPFDLDASYTESDTDSDVDGSDGSNDKIPCSMKPKHHPPPASPCNSHPEILKPNKNLNFDRVLTLS